MPYNKELDGASMIDLDEQIDDELEKFCLQIGLDMAVDRNDTKPFLEYIAPYKKAIKHLVANYIESIELPEEEDTNVVAELQRNNPQAYQRYLYQNQLNIRSYYGE